MQANKKNVDICIYIYIYMNMNMNMKTYINQINIYADKISKAEMQTGD